MRVNWYITTPLILAAASFACAAYWGYGLLAEPYISNAIGVGVLIGLGITGIVQSLYRWMLHEQDTTIRELTYLLTVAVRPGDHP